MEITIMASLPAKWNMNINTCQWICDLMNIFTNLPLSREDGDL